MPEPSQCSATPQTEDNSPAQTQPISGSSETSLTFKPLRRGRPPGRPNTTVKESEYEDNVSVQRWNAAKVEPAIPAVAINIREALRESSLTRDAQQEIYKLPSREFIYFVQGWINSRQIASQRASYVNGLLIHSRGQDSLKSCDQCADKRVKNALGPFLTCRVLVGSFHNCCSNCKWFDTASACSLYTGPVPNRKRRAKRGGGDEVARVAGSVPVGESVGAATGIAGIQQDTNGREMAALSLPGPTSNNNPNQQQ